MWLAIRDVNHTEHESAVVLGLYSTRELAIAEMVRDYKLVYGEEPEVGTNRNVPHAKLCRPGSKGRDQTHQAVMMTADEPTYMEV